MSKQLHTYCTGNIMDVNIENVSYDSTIIFVKSTITLQSCIK